MFKMLVFLVAAPQVAIMSWLALLLLSSGDFGSGLPLASLVLMSVSYLVSGAGEVFKGVKERIRRQP